MGMKDSQPLVSIGMPVYNGELYLRQALDSLLAQDYQNFELIISDNASTDATAEICQEYLAKDPRIQYTRNSSNIGPLANFFKVLDRSDGEYFMWACHDDSWEESFISTLLEPFRAKEGTVMVCCDFDEVYHVTGKVVGHTPLNTRLNLNNSIFENAKSIIHVPIAQFFYGLYSTKTLKASRFSQRRKTYDFSDLLLINEMSLTGKVHFVPEKLFHDGVKEAVRPVYSIAKRRLPGFRLTYRTYYLASLRFIAAAASLTLAQKLYLMNLLTNQVLDLIAWHEAIPDFAKKIIRTAVSLSHRLSRTLAGTFRALRSSLT